MFNVKGAVAILGVLSMCMPLHAQQQEDDSIPLRNWSAPRYWQPPVEKAASKDNSQREVNLSGPLDFIAVTPCRVADTRNASGSLGGPIQIGNTPRTYPILSSACGIPSTAKSSSLNITIVPLGSPQGPVGYLAVWPSGSPQPLVSTLNSLTAGTIANAAIVPAGTNGSIDVFVSNTTHVIIDINGYFADAPSAITFQFTDFGLPPGFFIASAETCPAGKKVTACSCGGTQAGNPLAVTVKASYKEPNAEACFCVVQNTAASGDAVGRRGVFCQ